MLGTGFTGLSILRRLPIAQAGRTQAEIFDTLLLVFLALGTIVGTVVISYTVYNAYKYRVSGDAEGRYDVNEDELAEKDDYGVARPQQGEIPTGKGKGGGKKLFMSFGLSAVLVLGLIIYSYSLLLYVESTGQSSTEEAINVDVEGYQFGWDYAYFEDEVDNESQALTTGEYNATKLNANADSSALVVPKGTTIQLDVTSRDVWHNYGINEFRAKTDAIPGETTTTWFEADKTGVFRANCFELCGQGHSNMHGDVLVVEQDEFVDWYTSQNGTDRSQLNFMEEVSS